jgi:hypothetical protein
MIGRLMSSRQGSLVAGIVTCAVVAGSLLGPAAPLASQSSHKRAPHTVFEATTGNDSEMVNTLPITRHAGRKPHVVMSLRPSDLPRLEQGDELKLTAEVQTTNTCVDRTERCIGRQYGFSPFVSAKLLLAAGNGVTGGHRAMSLGHAKSVHCGQQRLNRNHHCVLTFQHARKRIHDPGALPCPPSRCFVNLVASAHNKRAQEGDVVVVGADRPDGSILQDKGRLNAVVTTPAASPPGRSSTKARIHRRLPVNRGGNWTSVYSARLSNVHRGDVLVAIAKQRTGISPVPYNVFLDTRIILTGRRSGNHANRLTRRISSLNGQLTEGNGFNCTHGRSAYRSPCKSIKAGLVKIRRDPIRHGHPVPVFVNLVCHTRPKLAAPRPGDHVDVLSHGHLEVAKYSGA